ncbi:DUF4278 domain-containing protein [Baaleninema sp.]|uniref:DUF4278 domain-containing protein n=1 Tax=Baaleninema sp. TaxID=3101197 RepID=UPI003CFFE5CC
MKFCYRGVWYDSSPSPIKTQEGPTIGKYRGATLRGRSISEIPTPTSCVKGKYRGVEVNVSF